LQSTRFDELASYLQSNAIRFGFVNQHFQFGPLKITLLLAPECGALEMDIALTSAKISEAYLVSQSDRRTEASLTVYIIQLPKSSVPRALEPFLTNKIITLQQLSGSDHVKQFFIRDNFHKMLKVFDQENGIGLLAFEDPDLLPPWELFSPIKEFIHLHALSHSCVLLHAASLVPSQKINEAILVVGPGGSGKSTLTAYATEQGMLTNGDDYVLVDLLQDKPQCWSVYRTLKLHPSSPVLRGTNRWRTWRYDSFTGKSVILADTLNRDGPLVSQATLSRICGVSLKKSLDVYNPKAQSIRSDPHRQPYLHSCMSTIQQIPYRIDATLGLSKKLHQLIPYAAYTIAPGIEGLQQALLAIERDAK
jgi:hypothetical protein